MVLQPVRVDSPEELQQTTRITNPSARQAAGYIRDMTTSLRALAIQHRMSTLALLLEMAAVEAADPKGDIDKG
jgi:hypothetical protein